MRRHIRADKTNESGSSHVLFSEVLRARRLTWSPPPTLFGKRTPKQAFAAGLLLVVLGLSLAPCAQATLAPVKADTFINSSGAEKNKNFGKDPSLKVTPTASTLIRFDLSTLPAGTIADDVEKATMLLWVNKVDASGSISVLPVTSPWTESTVTYNTQPGVGGPLPFAHHSCAEAVPVGRHDGAGESVADDAGLELWLGVGERLAPRRFNSTARRTREFPRCSTLPWLTKGPPGPLAHRAHRDPLVRSAQRGRLDPPAQLAPSAPPVRRAFRVSPDLLERLVPLGHKDPKVRTTSPATSRWCNQLHRREIS